MKRQKNIILVSVALGLLYGWISANKNQNPYYQIPPQHNILKEEDISKAWHWEPSPLFLPSYLLCKVPKHLQCDWCGIWYTKSGYLFKCWPDLWFYTATSIVIGGIMGMLVGHFVKPVLKKPMRH